MEPSRESRLAGVLLGTAVGDALGLPYEGMSRRRVQRLRAPLLGVYARDDVQLRALVRASTRVTHTDPRAESGALAIALAAHRAPLTLDPGARLLEVAASSEDRMGDLLRRAAAHIDSPQGLAAAFECQRGVSGFVDHTVPVALGCWARNPRDLRAALTEVVSLGGDTDTTAAIVGGLVGAHGGRSAVEGEWLDGLHEWPRSVAWMDRLARALARGEAPPTLPTLAILGRNAVFLALVYGLILRRLLPPY